MFRFRPDTRSIALALGIAASACSAETSYPAGSTPPAPGALPEVAPTTSVAPQSMPASVGGAAAPMMAATPTTLGPAATSTGTTTAPAPAHDMGADHMNDGLDHCRFGDAPDPRDATLPNAPERFQSNSGQVDLLMPKAIRDWMTERGMQRSHDDWHLIRQIDSKCFKSNAKPEDCNVAKDLAARGLKRFPIQECSRLAPGAKGPGDGKMFMWEHRHMLDNMNSAFPQHRELFTGFAKVPRSQDDPNNPVPSRSIRWSQSQLAALDQLENIEQNAAMFPDEEYLAWFIQCRVLWTESNPNGQTDNVNSGFHLAMHAQWAVFGSPSSVGEQRVSIENFTFWKLHGWIDSIWHRWRATKGLTDEEPEYKQGVFDMCKEMHELTILRDGQSASVAPTDTTPAPAETGFFAEQVRPFLNERCSTCHGGPSPVLGMVLGGTTETSAQIVSKLINADSSNKQYKLIVPGSPEQSWLYLKASGTAPTAACTNCVTDVMPPAGEMLTSAQLNALHQWIASGAKLD